MTQKKPRFGNPAKQALVTQLKTGRDLLRDSHKAAKLGFEYVKPLLDTFSEEKRAAVTESWAAMNKAAAELIESLRSE